MAVPSAVHRAHLTGRLASTTPLLVSISLEPSNPDGLRAYADAVNDPASPDFHRFLSVAEVGRRFGAAPEKIRSLVSYLRTQGLSVALVSKNGLSILVEGTAAKVERAFDTNLATYETVAHAATDRARFFSYTEPPKLPASLAQGVLHVGGLENSHRPVPRSLTPTQARRLYKSASLYDGGLRGQGRTIAITSFDGFRLSNLAPFYKRFNLPTPPGGIGKNVRVVTVAGGSAKGSSGGEGDLDIQMALGAAPLCNLIVYDGGGDLLSVLAHEAEDDVADIVSESYGFNLSPSEAAAAHNAHLAMTAQGMTYLGASGDSGTDFGGYDYPDYEPEVLLVGGTIAKADSSGGRSSEIGWSRSGGGWSTNPATFNALPSWQKGTGVPTGIDRRLGPDIALNAAGPDGAYPFFLNGSLVTGYTGTSFGPPVLAGMLAVAEQKLDALGYFKVGKKRLGRLQDLIYAQNGRADVWTDVLSGTNGDLPNGVASVAGMGWDSVTGWGALDVEGFVAALAATPSGTVPTDYVPSAVSIFSNQGRAASGNAARLKRIDQSYYAIGSVKSVTTGMVASVKLTFPVPKGTVSSATLKFVTFGPPTASLSLLAYNVRTKTYDPISTASLTGSDAPFAAAIGSLADYVSIKGVLILVERTSVSTRNAPAFVLKTDQAIVTIP